jgi:hypothetical protein
MDNIKVVSKRRFKSLPPKPAPHAKLLTNPAIDLLVVFLLHAAFNKHIYQLHLIPSRDPNTEQFVRDFFT